VRGIASVLGLPESSPDVRLGGDATERMVKQANHFDYQYEHFATHAIIAGDIPVLKEPALILSFPSPGDPVSDDGYLTMSEIFALRMNADLVVLSACKTALGEDVPGEGLVGLTRAFMYAGSPTVIATLWSVADDESNVNLMTSMYRHLRNGKSKDEALTLAKRELRHDPAFAGPFHWAPFILLGEGR